MPPPLIAETPAPGVRMLTLNRPAVINALDEALCLALDSALADAAEDPAVRCIVLTGAGERGFSAGYDLTELAEYSFEEMRVQNARRYDWMWSLAIHPKPIIAALHGVCMGAGAIIATCCDIRIVAQDTRIRFTAAAYGTAMLTWCLPAVVGEARAREFLMTSRFILADEALRTGLANAVSAPGRLLSEAIAMAGMIADHPPSGPQDIKRLLREGGALSQHHRWQMERDYLINQPSPIGSLHPTKDMLKKLKNRH